MLDTRGRRYVQPIVNVSADTFLKWGLTANNVTVISFLIGVTSGLFVYFEQTLIALLVLWFSGFLDVVDGTMARKTKPSSFGTVLDVSFDRLVEISVILGLAFRYPDAMWVLLLLSVSIIYCMTIFLTVGAVSEKQGVKSFYYQSGLAERTEGFILFSLMIIFTDHLILIGLIFLAVEIITSLQRLFEAKVILGKHADQ
ncbi:CDP-alcohol phosphatidyltransferase family protein [Salisediminibacterium selenitireducens]|uniref:CDP-alcohol phosphatidyltransferase n=1 Tax=Bacillus selenitireducens (strain ATCC 700615 / DSM 15326 / MLS10) TaxID=439292 RepID=D6Y1G8_BACIE|nr:CDP-alcohol phosphatidyltransferase family protein [Salisediminibacterium selenitireducens]ADI00755.1 CDP-alcohol phosphatidyltransferase [[Bacillus] selenitireducens MLS10]